MKVESKYESQNGMKAVAGVQKGHCHTRYETLRGLKKCGVDTW